jgi:hypothetical protein
LTYLIFNNLLNYSLNNSASQSVGLSARLSVGLSVGWLIDQSGQEGANIGTDGKPGSGAYSLTWYEENNLNTKAYEKINKDVMRKRVWEHTMKAFRVIEEGKVFTE